MGHRSAELLRLSIGTGREVVGSPNSACARGRSRATTSSAGPRRAIAGMVLPEGPQRTVAMRRLRALCGTRVAPDSCGAAPCSQPPSLQPLACPLLVAFGNKG